MMRTLLLTFFVLIQLTVLGQHRLAVKSNPLNLVLEGDKYVMPVGLEYAFGSFSVQAEQVVMLTKYNNYSLRANLNYSKTNIQLRYYIDGMFSDESLGFVGIQGTTKRYDFLEASGQYISGEGRNIRYDNSRVETENYSAFAISGVQLQSKSNFIFELVLGFGIREVSVDHNPEEITFVDRLDPFLFENFEPEWREGTRTVPGILLQMRFGYLLLGNNKDK